MSNRRILLLALGTSPENGGAVSLAAATLKKDFAGRVDVLETSAAGRSLLAAMRGYESVLILNSMENGAEAGAVLEFSTESSPALLPSAHIAGLPASVVAARRRGIPFPERVAVLGIVGSGPASEAALPFLVRRAKRTLDAWVDLELYRDAASSAGA